MGSKAIRSGQPAKCHESSASRVACSWTWASGPTRPAHRLMAGVSSISWPVPTTDSAAHPTWPAGGAPAPTVPTMSSRAPAWGRVAVTTTRSGSLADGLEDGAGHLAGGLRRPPGAPRGRWRRAPSAQPPVGVNRMSSERR